MGCRFTAAECYLSVFFHASGGAWLEATLCYAAHYELPCCMFRFRSRAHGGIGGHHKCTPALCPFLLRQHIHPCFLDVRYSCTTTHNTRQTRATIFNQGRQSRAWYFSMLSNGPTDTRPVTFGCVAKYSTIPLGDSSSSSNWSNQDQ
jgi:hypothetical protein